MTHTRNPITTTPQKPSLLRSLSYVSRVVCKPSESMWTTRSRSISTPIGWLVVMLPRVVREKRSVEWGAVEVC